MDGKRVVELRGVGVAVNGTVILANVNLDIVEGEFVCLIGKSGVGKTTLLHTIAGFLPHSGVVRRPKKLGVVFQNYSIFPWMTAKENVAFGLDHLSDEKRRRLVEYYLTATELKDHANKYPSELSGGQMQRVALARALAPQPDLILMDEPFGSLDVFTREKMRDLLLKLWKQEGRTVLFVTHSVEEAIFLSNRVMVMKNGTITRVYDVDLPDLRTRDLKFRRKFLGLVKKAKEELSR
jgi:ABC-type nitrate/sulfonate/bicarbonate transport system ATPase subunit